LGSHGLHSVYSRGGTSGAHAVTARLLLEMDVYIGCRNRTGQPFQGLIIAPRYHGLKPTATRGKPFGLERREIVTIQIGIVECTGVTMGSNPRLVEGNPSG